MLHICGGLVLAGCQAPTDAAPWLPSSAGWGRENRNKGLWFEIRVGSSLAPPLLLGQGIHACPPRWDGKEGVCRGSATAVWGWGCPAEMVSVAPEVLCCPLPSAQGRMGHWGGSAEGAMQWVMPGQHQHV